MIKTFDNKVWTEKDILKEMYDDEFYYGYLGKNALSSSAFKGMLNDFDKFLMDFNGIDTGDGQSQALRDGRLIHLAVLEPQRLNDLTIIESTKGSKLFKEAVADLGAAIVYTSRELERCTDIASCVNKNFDAFMMLQDCSYETPGIKMIKDLPVRAKADAMKNENNKRIGIDLKTTRDASNFDDAIDWFGYDLQGALYNDIFGFDEFIFIVVDKSTRDVLIRRLKTSEIEKGKEKLNIAINMFKKWQRTNV